MCSFADPGNRSGNRTYEADIDAMVARTELLPTQSVPISSLVAGPDIRLSGSDMGHVHALAQTVERLPPIVAHRPTTRILDGEHRVQAAGMRGENRDRGPILRRR